MSTNIHENCNKGCTHAIPFIPLHKLPPVKDRNSVAIPDTNVLLLDTLAHRYQKSQDALSTRARHTYFSYALNRELVRYAEENNSLIGEDNYWDAYHCNNVLFQDLNGHITTKYCKTRWCVTCSRIRSAIMWNAYEPPMRNLPCKFVTLTTSFTNYCTSKDDLDFARKLYGQAIQFCMRKLQKKIGKVVALRKLEVTYEQRKLGMSFHLHYHFLIDDTNNAPVLLRELWCEYFSEKKWNEFVAEKKKNNKYYAREKYDIINKKIRPYATYYAQHIRVADERSFAETLKYLCKTHTEELNEVTQEWETKLAYEPRIMDIIFFVFKNKKVVQPYNLPEVEIEDFDVTQSTIIVAEKGVLRTWKWVQDFRTWCDTENGEWLTDGKFLSKNKKKYNLLNNSS